jgi:molybdopterin molybdotransferase
LIERLTPVESETLPLAGAEGRVLAAAVSADRDSPPHDVSAMDGYAVRLADLAVERVPVAGEVGMGAEPPPLPPGQALRIMTGACVPLAGEAIVVREDVDERPGTVALKVAASSIRSGQHIRRRGENLRAGADVVAAGTAIGPHVAAALAAFGCSRPIVRRRVRVAVVVTGDELLGADATPSPWQIRDSNGPALRALLDGLPWVECVSVIHARDDRALLMARIGVALERADAVFVTGGVSMGVHDHVPDAVAGCGGDIVFHRLPIRPGKPLLAAVGPKGQAIIGLPGNPVAVLVAGRWFGIAALRRLAGLPEEPELAQVVLADPGPKAVDLWWFRLVRQAGPGRVELVPSQGSGDLVSAARSAGFVLTPPLAQGAGPWPFTPWTAAS